MQEKVDENPNRFSKVLKTTLNKETSQIRRSENSCKYRSDLFAQPDFPPIIEIDTQTLQKFVWPFSSLILAHIFAHSFVTRTELFEQIEPGKQG